jgi:hypothetical protein
MVNFTRKEYAMIVLSARLEMSRAVVMVRLIKISSIEETSLVEDVEDLGMREKQDDAINITAQVTTSRPENYEMIERHLARVKMKMVDTILKAMVVVEMYKKANTGGHGVLSRTQLELEAVLDLELQV